MITANTPENEIERLQSLQNYQILDSLPEEDYDAISKIASSICNTLIALISLIDKDRQWIKANHGLDARETSRDFAFCAHSILEPDNGPGIPEKYKEKVFKMFETLSNEGNSNTGIGLATVKSIIDRLGGACSLEGPKENNTGICFQFKLLIKDITS